MSRRRIVWLVFASVLLVAGLFLFVLPGRTYLSQRQSLAAATVRQRVLSSQNAKLAQRIQELQTDAEIERLARQEYGLVKPGEDAYVILPPRQAPAAPSQDRRPQKTPHHRWWELWK
jgi:cell division protein FtsB